MKKKPVFGIALTLFLVFVDFVAAQYTNGVFINEIFPNPSGDDNNKEFVEVWSAGFVNFSGFVFGDEAGNDTLVALQYVDTNYSLIVEEGFSYFGINASVYSIGATIGNNLGNTGDSLFFYAPSGILLDAFSYTSSFVIEGKSIERKNIVDSFEWLVSLEENGTPGRENSILGGYTNVPEQETNTTENNTQNPVNSVQITSLLPPVAAVNQSITKGFRIDNLDKEKIDAVLHIAAFFEGSNFFQETRMFENISRYRTKDTLALAFSKEGNYTVCGTVESNQYEEDFSDNTACANITVIDYSSLPCDRNLTLLLNQSIFPNKKAVPFRFLVDGDFKEQELPFAVSYSIAEFRGEVVKDERNTTNEDTKRWTPNIKKSYGLFLLSAELLETTCADTNTKNNRVQAQILVENSLEEEGSVAVEHIYLGSDGVVRTGDILRAKVSVYTGNLSRLSSEHQNIKVFVKDAQDTVVSPITQLTVSESFTEATFIVPVILDYSCTNFPTAEEQYMVIVQGLGDSTREKFPVAGVKKELCSSSSQGEFSNPSFTAAALPQDTITTNITLRAIDGKAHLYKVSSKVYRGPKTYTGNFFANQQEIELLPGEEKQVTLVNTLENLTPGTYKTKIQIQKDQQKTLKEFREELLILDTAGEEAIVENAFHIVSFRALSEELQQETPLLAQIQGTGNITLVLDTLFSREEKTFFVNGSVFVSFNATLAEGKNTLVLSIVEDATAVESKALILFADTEGIETLSLSDNEKTMQREPSGMEAITGAVAQPLPNYTTSFSKINAFVNYGLIALLLFFVIFLVFQKAQPI